MNESFRWYGPSDPVTLSDIRQAGASSVVSALHEIQNGVVWNRSAIETHQKIIKNSGLNWNVVESVPIHEDIKQRNGSFELYIDNYKRTLENLSSFNIKTVCYIFPCIKNFTPSSSNNRIMIIF